MLKSRFASIGNPTPKLIWLRNLSTARSRTENTSSQFLNGSSSPIVHFVEYKKDHMKTYFDISSNQDRMSELDLYLVELELEVDRLRRRDTILRHVLQDCLMDLKIASRNDGPILDLEQLTKTVARISDDLNRLFEDWELAEDLIQNRDSVAEIPIRRFVEKIFRFQQKLHTVKTAMLCMDIMTETIEWFPARLLHIIDNIISNSMRYRDPNIDRVQVSFSLSVFPESYEIRVSDNGVGIPEEYMIGLTRLSNRSQPNRTRKLGVGLAVVKVLVENCCGRMHVESSMRKGTTVSVVLPRFEILDDIEKDVRSYPMPFGPDASDYDG